MSFEQVYINSSITLQKWEKIWFIKNIYNTNPSIA